MSVHQTYIIVASFTEFDCSYILEPQHSTVAFRTDDHILIVGDVLVTSAIFQHISEGVLRFRSEGSGRSFKVLLGQYCRNVRRHKPVFAHLSRIEPDTERVISSSYVHLTDTGDT